MRGDVGKSGPNFAETRGAKCGEALKCKLKVEGYKCRARMQK